MWALVLAKLAELGLAIVSAIKSVSAAVAQWQAVTLGRTAGRADSEAEQAAAARQDGGVAAHTGSIKWMASLAKPSVTRSPSSGTASLDGTAAWSFVPLRSINSRITGPR
jgi:hypothetical protein